jgi:hypothetical protein
MWLIPGIKNFRPTLSVHEPSRPSRLSPKNKLVKESLKQLARRTFVRTRSAWPSQSQAKTKVICSQLTKHGTAEPFHFLYSMGPISDVTILRRLCMWLILDMPCPCGAVAGNMFGRFQPEPSQTKVICSQLTKQPGTAQPFHFLHMGPMSDVNIDCSISQIGRGGNPIG